MTSILELIAEPKRQRLLQLVWDKERSAGELAGEFAVTFGAISQHLRALRDAELVKQRKVGRQRFYRANKEKLGPLAAALESMWSVQLAKLKELAEREMGGEPGQSIIANDQSRKKERR